VGSIPCAESLPLVSLCHAPDSGNSSVRRPLCQQTTVEGSIPCAVSLPLVSRSHAPDSGNSSAKRPLRQRTTVEKARSPALRLCRKEDRGSAVLTNAEPRQQASRYAERSTLCRARCSDEGKEKRDGPFQGPNFCRQPASQLTATQNTPPGTQQAQPAWKSFRRPATKSYVAVPGNTDIPQVYI
jgi:hypothetical protein